MSLFTQPMLSAALTRLLLAEDNRAVSHLGGLLAESGYQVESADDGSRALSILQSDDPPALALLDWDMPGMNGLEICRRLRNSKRRRSSYVILLTPSVLQHDRVEGFEAGADDCIFTPADPRELDVRLQVGAKILLERALYESEERFYNSFEHAGIGMAIVRVGGEFEKVNRAICSLLGYSAEELKKLGLHEVCHGEDQPSSHDLLWKFIEGGDRRSAESERRFVTKAGTPIWISLTISLVLDSDDLPACFVLQAQDITARRKADQDLKESLTASRHALKALADQKHAMDQHAIIDATDVHGRITYVNDKFCTSSKYAREELLGRDHRILNSGHHPKAFFRQMYQTINSGQVWHGEIRNRTKDGSIYWVDTTIVPFLETDSEPRQFVVIRSDITERKTAEDALQAAYVETDLFLQCIPSILIGIDGLGHITKWNEAATNTLGRTQQQVLGKPINDCGIRWIHPDMKTEVAHWLTTKGSYRCNDLSFETESGIRFLGLGVRRIPLENTQKAGFILTGADITARKGLEEQLRQAQKLEAIGQLAAGIAHEINTPTQYAGDNLRFLKDSWESISKSLLVCSSMGDESRSGAISAETMRAFEQLRKECDIPYLLKEFPQAIAQSLEGLQRVAKIVRGIKEFSHPGSKEKRAVNLNRAIETTITVSRNEWKYCADLVTAFDETLPPVLCLVGEFNQVILNLIVNASHAIASKAVNDGLKGTITVTTRRQDDWAEILIADSGTGIPEGIRSRIFEPFFTTKEVGKGTGQGLALAHTVVVNQHQGQLWFDSEEGRGTTFHVRLPLLVAESAPI